MPFAVWLPRFSIRGCSIQQALQQQIESARLKRQRHANKEDQLAGALLEDQKGTHLVEVQVLHQLDVRAQDQHRERTLSRFLVIRQPMQAAVAAAAAVVQVQEAPCLLTTASKLIIDGSVTVMSNDIRPFGVFTQFCKDAVVVMADADHGEERISSLRGRGFALLRTIGASVVTAISPLLATGVIIGMFVTNDRHQEYWKDHKCIALLDITCTILLSPLIALAAVVRSVIAMIFYPGIIYQQSDEAKAEQEKADAAAARAKESGQSAQSGKGGQSERTAAAASSAISTAVVGGDSHVRPEPNPEAHPRTAQVVPEPGFSTDGRNIICPHCWKQIQPPFMKA